ncbi:MAG TPA: hypothetical protein VIH59_22090 [Candidatus Tectomicrobia bacterium]|jgi:hypothetical protein
MTLLWEGEDYVLGSAGSLVLCCPACGAERFRDSGSYFAHPTWYRCWARPHALLGPIKVAELATRWQPLWQRLDAH